MAFAMPRAPGLSNEARAPRRCIRSAACRLPSTPGLKPASFRADSGTRLLLLATLTDLPRAPSPKAIRGERPIRGPMKPGADPSNDASDQLDALRRFFLWRYSEVAQAEYAAVSSVFPLVGSSRLDLVHVAGSGRVHFLFSEGDGRSHRSYVHALTLGEALPPLEGEKEVVARHLGSARVVLHFVVEPPFDQRFEGVGREAEKAVAAHARRPVVGPLRVRKRRRNPWSPAAN